MPFEFATAARIIFGPGALAQLGPSLKSQGRRALLVTGGHPERAGRVLSNLAENNFGAILFPVAGEPAMAMIVSLSSSITLSARSYMITLPAVARRSPAMSTPSL